MQKTILLDIGEVLIEWNLEKLVYSTLPEDASKEEKAEMLHLLWELNKEWDQGSFKDGLIKAKERYPQHAEKLDTYDRNWLDYGLGSVIEGTVDLMKRLKAEGHRLIAASNFAADTFERGHKASRMDFVDLFDELHVSGQINIIKPDPTFFTTLIEKFDVDLDHCLFTDDRQDNIDAAKSCGIDSVLFTTPQAFEAALIERGFLKKA